MNFASKIYLNHRILTLEKEIDYAGEIAMELSRKIEADREAISELEAKTEALNVRADDAEESQRELQESLAAQTEAIEQELQRQEQILSAHKRDMDEQKEVINRLKGLRHRTDMAIDAFLVLAAVWISGLSLLQFPIHLFVRILSSRSNRRSWLAQFLRSVFVVVFVSRFRPDPCPDPCPIP